MDYQVKIVSPMVVDLDRFNKMRKRFVKHYFLENCDANFGGQEIQIPWNSFSLAVTGFMSTNSTKASEVAVRLVHCYDETLRVLYLRMQILTMSSTSNERQFTLNEAPCEWYDLSNSTMNTTNNTNLFDEPYLAKFYYCHGQVCSPQTAECLQDDSAMVKYARNITLPWFELMTLYQNNGSPSNAVLCLDAACRCTNTVPDVKYQHTVVSYLRDSEGIPLLNNIQGEYPFTNKAADMGTICPVNCNMYILPKGATGDGDCNDENDIEDDE